MILVDVHEPQEIIAALQKSTEVIVQVLPHGDYVIKNIAIERKTASDFISSLTTHRLFPQLTTMKSCYPASFLIVEIYDLNYFHNTPVIYGTLLHILLDLNIKILFTATPPADRSSNHHDSWKKTFFPHYTNSLIFLPLPSCTSPTNYRTFPTTTARKHPLHRKKKSTKVITPFSFS